jgi:uncharacterized protein (TIGR03437 family)
MASVRVELVAQGGENALGFSLNFPAATLSNPQTVLGADAAGASLNTNTNDAAQGRLGISLALPAGQGFAAGARQLVVVTFNIASNATGGSAPIGFTDQPITRELVDVNATTLSATYLSGAIAITQGFEADVNPRPNGNGTLSIADWVLLGRFAAGLDTAAPGSEFQRADCAPRNTLGNGSITLADWVQAGRYAAGLDPVTPAGGPTGPPSSLTAADGARQRVIDYAAGASAIRIRGQARMPELPGGPNSMTVYLDARGDESAIGFSLQFDPARARFAGAELGPDLSNATLLLNTRQLASGRVGLMLALPAGESLRAGQVALLTARFTMAPGGSPAVARIAFRDEPVARAAVDVNAQNSRTEWTDVELPVDAVGSVSVSAANYSGDVLAPEAIVTTFADGLATATQLADSLPLPLDLLGTRVAVRDSAGVERAAPLFFVSYSQINYLMPAGTAPGLATVTITSGDGRVFSQMIEIEPIAPGLFTANSDGQGAAAALALRVRQDGSRSYETATQYDGSQGRYGAAPVELGDERDQVYLLLFGTGIRSFTSLGSEGEVKATIGGVEVRVTYAGPQGSYHGVDQINLLLPRALAGRGPMDLILTVGGRPANTVRVDVR